VGNKGGRPTKEQIAERESLRAAIERKREERASILADRYFDMALADPPTMRHLVDKVMPPAKQEVGVTMQHGFDRSFLERLMETKEGREASDAVTKALMAQKNWNTVADKIED
jgi:hypothetical protein